MKITYKKKGVNKKRSYYCILRGIPSAGVAPIEERYHDNKALWVYYTVLSPSKLYAQVDGRGKRFIPTSLGSNTNTKIITDIKVVYDTFDNQKCEELKQRYTFQKSEKPFKPILLPQPKPYELLLRTELVSVMLNIWEYIIFVENSMSLSKNLLLSLTYTLRDINSFLNESKMGKIKNREAIKGLNFLLEQFRVYKTKKKYDIVIDSPLKKLLYEIFVSLREELVERKIIIICKRCGYAAEYYRTKKFCSKNVDGRDCPHRYYSHEDYEKHKPKRRKTSKNWIRKTRKDDPGYDRLPTE